MRGAHLKEVDLPDFGDPTVEPVLPADLYARRVARARAGAEKQGFDALVVHADREHSANLAHLTGFGPRFDEPPLVLTPGRSPALLVGNEGWGYAGISPLELRRVLFQSFSLLAQPRSESKPLVEILREDGISAGGRVGVAGWKYFGEWVSSPIYDRSKIELRSGMAFQVDVIPATGPDYFTTNIEDGIALADAEPREAFADRYPQAWGRIEARRAFMEDVLGIRLKPEALPFSNIPAYLPPFLLSPRQVMAIA